MSNRNLPVLPGKKNRNFKILNATPPQLYQLANTLPNQIAKNQYTASGSQGTFTYAFYIPDDDSIAVYLTPAGRDPNPNLDYLILNVDYTVTGSGNPTGGTIVFTVTPSTGAILTFIRDVPYAINTQFSETIDFSGQNLDNELENIVLQTQQLNTIIQTQCLQYASNELVTPGTPSPQIVVPILTNIDNQVWISQGGRIIAAQLDCDDPGCSTLRSQLAQNSSTNTAGANLVGFYDPTTSTPTTVNNFLLNTVLNSFLPVGALLFLENITPPFPNVMLANGQAINRVDYPEYFSKCAFAATAVLTSGNPLITISTITTANLYPGMAVTGIDIPSNTAILSIDSSSSLTLTNPPSGSGTLIIIFYKFGAGDGVTTFNIRDARNRALIGAGGNYVSGQSGGSATSTIGQTNLPAISPTVIDPGHFHMEGDVLTQAGGGTPDVISPVPPAGSNVIHTSISTTGITIAPLGSGTPLNTQSPFSAINIFVRIK